jgi:hypothetical protein
MDNGHFLGSANCEEDAFLRSFENCEYSNEKFKHADHIRLTWVYIRRLGVIGAEERIGASIYKFAASLGHPEKYHETITRAWFRLVYGAYCTTPDIADFAKFIASHLSLLDPKALLTFYSPERLFSEEARWRWLEPDLRPLP